MFLLEKLTALLPTPLQPFAKAVWPTIATVVGVGVQWVSTGALDGDALKLAASGAVLALLSFSVPNAD
jgi:hypothetical protein